MKISNEPTEIKVSFDTEKVYPALEDLEVTPSMEKQYFKSDKYGYNEIIVGAIEGETLEVTPKKNEQSYSGVFTKVDVNAIESEELNVTPSEEEQLKEGLFDKVSVGAIPTEEKVATLDFSNTQTVEVTPTEGSFLKKVTINKDENLIAENIAKDVVIEGIVGNFEGGTDTTDATATADDIIAPKTAYVNGEKITGKIIPTYGEFEYTNMEKTISDTNVLGVAYSNDNEYRFEFLSQTGTIKVYDNANGILIKTYAITEIVNGANTSDAGRIGCSIYFDEAGVKKCYVCFNCYVGSATHSFIIVKFNTKTKSFETSSVIKYDMSLLERQPAFITFGHKYADLMSITVYNTQRRHETTIGRIRSNSFEPFWTGSNGGNTSVNGTYSGFAFGANDKVLYRAGCKSGYSAYLIYDYASNTVTKALSTMTDIACQPKGELCTYNGQLKRYNLNNNTLNVLDLVDNDGITYTVSLTGTSYVFVSDNILLGFINSNTIRAYFIEEVDGRYSISRYVNFTVTGWTNYVLYERGLNLSTNAVAIRNSTSKTIEVFELSKNVISLSRNQVEYHKTTNATVEDSNLLKNKIAYGREGKLIGTMPNNGILNYTPTTTAQSIPAGYTSGGSVSGDENLLAENIKKDVTIFGVTGTHEGEGGGEYNAVIDGSLVPTNTSGSNVSHTLNRFLVKIPELDTSQWTNTGYLFYMCQNLVEIPQLDTSNVTNMNSMFYHCDTITEIPAMDTSKVTSMSSMFYYCKKLTEIPNLYTSNVTRLDGFTQGCDNLVTIPQLDCGKINNFGSNAIGGVYTLTNLGGFKDLGKAYTQKSNNYSSYSITISNTKLNHESLMNVINNLYDLNLTYDVANGGTLYTQKLTLGSTNTAKLTAEEIAIATNKGWTVS